jgi:hypothetical protein
MGYVTCFSPCINCHRPFTYHPNKVPSALINGTREPICRDCVDRANPLRVARGLAPIEVLPGAYESAEESEISWE